MEREEVACLLTRLPFSRVSVGERVEKGAVRLPVVEQPRDRFGARRGGEVGERCEDACESYQRRERGGCRVGGGTVYKVRQGAQAEICCEGGCQW